MGNQINKPRGTNDFYGSTKIELDNLVKALDEIAIKYGVEPIEVPIFEESKLYKRSVGESSDIVSKETFDLISKGDHDYTLRPEFTAGINRAVIENKLYATPDLPLKYYYFGPTFRYERPQVGRFREFHQWGVEFLDVKIDIVTLIQCLTLFYNQAKSVLGINPIFKLNFLGSFESREVYKRELKAHFEPNISSMCSDCQRRLLQNPLRILDCKVQEDRKYIETAPKVTDFLSSEDKAEYEAILKHLDALHIPYVLDDRLVRGLDYYTGLVFELYDGNKLELGALGAGGKYGHLMNDLGGPDFEGIGYSFGAERLVMSKVSSQEVYNPLDVFMIVLDSNKIDEALSLGEQLKNELNLKVSYASLSKALTGSIKMADRKHASYTLIFDDRGYHVKDMKTREQVDFDKFDKEAIIASFKENK